MKNPIPLLVLAGVGVFAFTLKSSASQQPQPGPQPGPQPQPGPVHTIGPDGPPDAIKKRMVDALITGKPATIRAEAKRLRSEGWPTLADDLEASARHLESPGGLEQMPERAPVGTYDPFVEPVSETTPDDRAFAAWIRDPRSGAPELGREDLEPMQGPRRLTDYERWVLGPYHYADDLTHPTLYLGMPPPDFPPGVKIPEQLWAVTTITGDIYFPNHPRSFLTRWWLAVLAHELYHVGQARLGLTSWQAQEAILKHGYAQSPVEVSARWKQRQTYDGVTKLAREFAANS